MKNHITNLFYGTGSHVEFIKGIQVAVNQISPQQGIFAGDNLFTYHKNLSFLDDTQYMRALENNILSDGSVEAEVEKSLIWRRYVLCWAAYTSLRLEGDFIECACYRGISAKIVCDYLDFNSTDKHYYLYDLFEHDESMNHHAMPAHGETLFDNVVNRFSDYPNVHVTQGEVPAILADICPEKIAFMHLDLNNADAEIGALEVLFERISPGGIVVLDDYGWLGYREQKLIEDKFFQKRGLRVLELPTGQGLVIK